MTEKAVQTASGPRATQLPSWPDWLIARLRALPGPTWLSFVVVMVALSALDIGARWAGGAVPVPEVSLTAIIEVSFFVLFLALYAGLNAIALRSLRSLRPALTVDDEEVDVLGRELVRTPGT